MHNAPAKKKREGGVTTKQTHKLSDFWSASGASVGKVGMSSVTGIPPASVCEDANDAVTSEDNGGGSGDLLSSSSAPPKRSSQEIPSHSSPLAAPEANSPASDKQEADANLRSSQEIPSHSSPLAAPEANSPASDKQEADANLRSSQEIPSHSSPLAAPEANSPASDKQEADANLVQGWRFMMNPAASSSSAAVSTSACAVNQTLGKFRFPLEQDVSPEEFRRDGLQFEIRTRIQQCLRRNFAADTYTSANYFDKGIQKFPLVPPEALHKHPLDFVAILLRNFYVVIVDWETSHGLVPSCVFCGGPTSRISWHHKMPGVSTTRLIVGDMNQIWGVVTMVRECTSKTCRSQESGSQGSRWRQHDIDGQVLQSLPPHVATLIPVEPSWNIVGSDSTVAKQAHRDSVIINETLSRDLTHRIPRGASWQEESDSMRRSVSLFFDNSAAFFASSFAFPRYGTNIDVPQNFDPFGHLSFRHAFVDLLSSNPPLMQTHFTRSAYEHEKDRLFELCRTALPKSLPTEVLEVDVCLDGNTTTAKHAGVAGALNLTGSSTSGIYIAVLWNGIVLADGFAKTESGLEISRVLKKIPPRFVVMTMTLDYVREQQVMEAALRDRGCAMQMGVKVVFFEDMFHIKRGFLKWFPNGVADKEPYSTLKDHLERACFKLDDQILLNVVKVLDTKSSQLTGSFKDEDGNFHKFSDSGVIEKHFLKPRVSGQFPVNRLRKGFFKQFASKKDPSRRNVPYTVLFPSPSVPFS